MTIANGGVISFGIYVTELDSVHDGQIWRMLAAGDNPHGFIYQLYVDGCLIPEHRAPGVSSVVLSTGRQLMQATVPFTHASAPSALGEPPSYDESVGQYDDDQLVDLLDSMNVKKTN